MDPVGERASKKLEIIKAITDACEEHHRKEIECTRTVHELKKKEKMQSQKLDYAALVQVRVSLLAKHSREMDEFQKSRESYNNQKAEASVRIWILDMMIPWTDVGRVKFE